MTVFKKSLSLVVFLIFSSLLILTGCQTPQPEPPPKAATPPIATPLPSDTETTEKIIRELEGRVKTNPVDFVALNKLTGYYLQRLRETGNFSYLELATKTTKASLDLLPAEANKGGLRGLIQVEISSHEFASARDHAKQLIELEGDKNYPYQLLGDALLELGDYEKAAEAFHNMETRTTESESAKVPLEQRFARMAFLRGDLETAKRNLTVALNAALAATPPARETVAWTRWQLGETAFQMGDYKTAEQQYRDALTTYPDYYRALASLGRVRAAQGDLQDAAAQYEKAVRILPDPTFVAGLGDVYKLAGRTKEAEAQYALVEQIAKLNKLNGVLYNRTVAKFYADHDLKPEDAYNQAKQEYAARQDIYGADVLAWTALKAGKLPEAQKAIKDALRLGTKDAMLFYHAGMIAKAANDSAGAKQYLEQALKLSPQFDPLQATVARKALEGN
ncbi:MAG: tetratricopeptide repeat protein [Blastocatellia bacterium]|nr:tetratricopeptide repeat protein [Blastocatellia bacterium]